MATYAHHLDCLAASRSAALRLSSPLRSPDRLSALASRRGGGLLPDSRASPRYRRTSARWTIHYRSPHRRRPASPSVVLPAWYGPGNNPPLPLVISPHGRGATGPLERRLLRPAPRGRPLRRDQPGRDGPAAAALLLRRPRPDRRPRADARARRSAALPWLRIDRTRIYALGSSMGGQETLLLVARHPELLAGAAALDSVTDLARRYRAAAGSCRARPALPRALGKAVRLRPPVDARARGRRVAGRAGKRVRRAQRPQPGAGDRRRRACRSRSGGAPRIGSCSIRSISPRRCSTQLRLADGVCARSPPTSAAGRTRRRCARVRCCRSRCSDFGLLPSDVRALPESVRHEGAPRCSDRSGTV